MVQRSGELMSGDQYAELMNYAVGYFKEARSQVEAELDWAMGLILGLVVTGSMGAGVGDKKPPKTDSDFDGKPVLSSSLKHIEKDAYSLTCLSEMRMRKMISGRKNSIEPPKC